MHINILNTKIILASSSPQRAQLLRENGFSFVVYPANIEEKINDQHSPQKNARRLAEEKATVVAKYFPEEVVLAADTLVISPFGKILGKPKNTKEARAMLTEKNGKTEEIITGFCVRFQEWVVSGAESSRVFYNKIGNNEINMILRSEEWRGVAGGLRIEGKTMKTIVNHFEGDFSNIIGLPIGRIAEALRSFPLSQSSV